MVNSDEHLLSVLEMLEECRAVLRESGRDETAQLVSVAILDLRMKLNQIGDAELKETVGMAFAKMMHASATGDASVALPPVD